jgi:hypothetical protein
MLPYPSYMKYFIFGSIYGIIYESIYGSIYEISEINPASVYPSITTLTHMITHLSKPGVYIALVYPSNTFLNV